MRSRRFLVLQAVCLAVLVGGVTGCGEEKSGGASAPAGGTGKASANASVSNTGTVVVPGGDANTPRYDANNPVKPEDLKNGPPPGFRYEKNVPPAK